MKPASTSSDSSALVYGALRGAKSRYATATTRKPSALSSATMSSATSRRAWSSSVRWSSSRTQRQTASISSTAPLQMSWCCLPSWSTTTDMRRRMKSNGISSILP